MNERACSAPPRLATLPHRSARDPSARHHPARHRLPRLFPAQHQSAAPQPAAGILAARLSRGVTAGLAGALILPALLGCQPLHPRDQLVVASRSSLESVDPVDITSFAGGQLLSAIGDPLYASDAAGRLRPRLATALPTLSADGLTARIPLRRGVRFHDGSRFDAAAMVFSLERFRALGKLGYLLDDRITAVRASGSHELELRLKRPYSALAA
ncbi:MAG: hypothetical protein RLZZ124_405, partial [Cyanobacteriota bacterium]